MEQTQLLLNFKNNTMPMLNATNCLNRVLNIMKPGSDCEIILSYLIDFKWHNIIDIMRDLKPGCVNWAARSRISDLKKKFLQYGILYRIENRLGENGQAEYKLVKL